MYTSLVRIQRKDQRVTHIMMSTEFLFLYSHTHIHIYRSFANLAQGAAGDSYYDVIWRSFDSEPDALVLFIVLWTGMSLVLQHTPQHTATHCNTLQHTATHGEQRPWIVYCPVDWHGVGTATHTATHCNTLQHTAAHCNTLQHTATHFDALQRTATHCNTLQYTATHSNALRQTATLCNTLCSALQHAVTQYTTPHHAATYCNTLLYTATHCIALDCSLSCVLAFRL